MATRLIIASNESGEHEEIIFTEDLETDGKDFFFRLEVTYDKEIPDVLPGIFPLEYNLRRT